MVIKIELKEQKEICFECRHTKRFHNSVHKEGACSQPTCQCSCFISSGVYYGMDLFDAYEKGIGDTLRVLRIRNYDISYTPDEIINFVKSQQGELK